jgi:hypothetical protein
MLRHFFHPDSATVYVLEALGVVSIVTYLVSNNWWTEWSLLARVGMVLLGVQYLFSRYCASVHWYQRLPDTPTRKHLGIELHFHRAMVFCTYTLLITTAWLWIAGGPTILWLSNAAFLFYSSFHMAFLRFHRADNDPLPVNYYSTKYDAPMTQKRAAASPTASAGSGAIGGAKTRANASV